MKKAINIFKTPEGYVLHVFVETPMSLGIVVWDDDKIAKNLKQVQNIVKNALKEQYLGVDDMTDIPVNKQDGDTHIITIYKSDDDEVSMCFHYKRGTDNISEYLPTMKKHEVMFALDEILAKKEYRLW